MKESAKSVIVELPHTNEPKGDRTPHEQEYNTGYGLSAIPNEVRGEIWCGTSQPEV